MVSPTIKSSSNSSDPNGSKSKDEGVCDKTSKSVDDIRIRTVFVDNLPLKTEKRFLWETFEYCDDIEQVNIYRVEKYYGKKVREEIKHELIKVASITFSTVSGAKKAVAKNPTWIADNYVNIQFFDDTHIDIQTFIINRVFIRNAPHSMTKEDVCVFFKNCGEPLYIRYLHKVGTEEFTGIIYIQFRSYLEVKYAIQKDGEYFDGKYLDISEDLEDPKDLDFVALNVKNTNLTKIFDTSFQGLRAALENLEEGSKEEKDNCVLKRNERRKSGVYLVTGKNLRITTDCTISQFSLQSRENSLGNKLFKVQTIATSGNDSILSR